MRVGLIDVDGHNFPNLPMMKISAWHKRRGDIVNWYSGFDGWYDVVYKSKVFDFTAEETEEINAGRVVRGGTGYGLKNELPYEIEHIYPDYGLYPDLTKDVAYGFLTRGCPRGCKFCIVGEKEGRCARHVAYLTEFWRGQKHVKLLDPNLLSCTKWRFVLDELITCGAWIDFTQGLDIRFMTKEKAELINRIKVKMIHFAWDNYEFRTYELLKKYRDRFQLDERRIRVYVLTNFNTTHEQDLDRVYKLQEMDYDPYVMIYDKQNATKRTRQLQRWVNNKFIYRSCPNFKDYLRDGVGYLKSTDEDENQLTLFDVI